MLVASGGGQGRIRTTHEQGGGRRKTREEGWDKERGKCREAEGMENEEGADEDSGIDVGKPGVPGSEKAFLREVGSCKLSGHQSHPELVAFGMLSCDLM